MANTMTSSLPLVRGSTAQIMITLYKAAMGLKDVSDEDPVLRRCVGLDAKTTQIKNVLTLNSRIPEQQGILDVHLSRISEAAKARGAQSAVMSEAYSMYQRQNTDLNQRYTNLGAQRDQLLQRYKKMVHEQHEAVSDLIQRQPKGSVSIADIERLLKSFEKDVNLLDKERSALAKDYDRVVKETTKLVEATRSAQIPSGIKPEGPG